MNTSERYTQISDRNFLALGVNHLAYVKTVEVDGKGGFSIHAADGTRMAVMANRDTAIATILRNDMEPVSLH